MPSPNSQPFRPLVIGIAGGSGSGKTTLSRHLVAALAEYRVLHIPMDRYFAPSSR